MLLGHVGDSRAYHYRDGRLEQISRDHTYVQTLVDSGLVSREEMAFHPWRNVVLRSLQASPEDELDRRRRPRGRHPAGGPAAAVQRRAHRHGRRTSGSPRCCGCNDPHSAAAVLTHAALAAGGRDNITGVVARRRRGAAGRRRRAAAGRGRSTSEHRGPGYVASRLTDTLRPMSNVKRPALEGTVAVRGDRRLQLRRVRLDARGPAIVWMHGTPGARRQIPLEARASPSSTACGIIGIDRPGHRVRRRRTSTRTSWTGPSDLEIMLDTLGVDTVRLIGLSGGGPYALAAGAALPDRVHGVGVLGGARSHPGRRTRSTAASSSSPCGWRRCSRSPGCRSGSPSPGDPAGPAARRPGARPVRRRAAAGGQEPAVPPGVQGDVPRRPAQRQPVPDLGAAQRPGAVHPRLGLHRRRRQRPGALVARRRRPHRAVRATASTWSSGCPTPR